MFLTIDFYLIVLDFPSLFCLLEYVIRIYVFPIASKRKIQIACPRFLSRYLFAKKLNIFLIQSKDNTNREIASMISPGSMKCLRLYILQNNNCVLETKQILGVRYVRMLLYSLLFVVHFVSLVFLRYNQSI